MQPVILITVVVLALLVIGMVILIIARRSRMEAGSEEIRPRGHWMGLGISTGLLLGIASGVAMENIPVGVGAGIAIGAGIGAALERRHRDELRPPTEQEQKMQKWGMALGLLVLLLVTGLFLLILLMRGN